MNGVEILATNEVAVSYTFNWTVTWIVGAIVLLGFVVIPIGDMIIHEGFDVPYFIVMSVAGVIFGLFFAFVCGNVFETPVGFEPQYKVTITDEVKMNEFLDRYEIVDVEGKIYTVRDRVIDSEKE